MTGSSLSFEGVFEFSVVESTEPFTLLGTFLPSCDGLKGTAKSYVWRANVYSNSHLSRGTLVDVDAAEVDHVDLRERQQLQRDGVCATTPAGVRSSASSPSGCRVCLHPFPFVGSAFPLHQQLRVHLEIEAQEEAGGVRLSCMTLVVRLKSVASRDYYARAGARARGGGLLLLRRTLTLCCFSNLGKIIFEGEFNSTRRF